VNRWVPPRARAAALPLAVGVLAFAVRYGWVGQAGARHRAVDPGALRSVRQVFDGHERSVWMAFLGDPPDPGPTLSPAAAGLHTLLGALTADPAALLALPAAAGALCCVAVTWFTQRHGGGAAAAWAGIYAILLPSHVAWSTSALPVSLALLPLCLGFLLPRAPAALAFAAAAGLRPELGLLGLLRGAPGLAGLAIGAATLLRAGAPPLGSPVEALVQNAPLIGTLGPPALLAAAATSGSRGVPLMGIALSVHLLTAGFTDQGDRHTLLGGLALCGAAGLAAARWGALPGLALALLLAADVSRVAAAWHRPLASPPIEVRGLPAAPPAGCAEVSDEPPIAGQPIPSHSLPSPAACRVWALAPEHTAWSSRGLQHRAWRMGRWYTLVPVAAQVPGGGRPWRVWMRLDD